MRPIQNSFSESSKEAQNTILKRNLGQDLGHKSSLKPSTNKTDLGRDDFLRLFLTQLKNQDPLQPKDSHELASQLAQFTSLEKLENINHGVQNLSESKGVQSNFKVLDLIGKKVSGDLSKIDYSGKEHSLQYELSEDAHEVDVNIVNKEGESVRKWTFFDSKKGHHDWLWDGLQDDGSPLPHDRYQLKVKAFSEDKKEIDTKTNFEGKVTGINFAKEGPLILLGDKSIKLSRVEKIFDPEENRPPSLPSSDTTVTDSSKIPSKSQNPLSQEG